MLDEFPDPSGLPFAEAWESILCKELCYCNGKMCIRFSMKRQNEECVVGATEWEITSAEKLNDARSFYIGAHPMLERMKLLQASPRWSL